MSFLNFVRPTRLKMILFVAILVYTFIAAVFLAQFNTTRNVGVPHRTSLEKVGIGISYPAVLLVTPSLFVTQHVFMKEVTMRPMLIRDGATDLPQTTSPELDTPIPSSTIWSYLAGLITELLALYILACLLSLLGRKAK